MKTIYSMSKTGKVTQWVATLNTTPNSEGFLEIDIESGYEDGKKINKTRLIKSGKNVGRANETSLLEQAILELERLYQAKYDKGYKDNIDNVTMTKQVDDISKPMLADKYPDKSHKLPDNVDDIFIQPKIDGLRCFIEKMDDSTVRFTSRSGKVFTHIPNIANEVISELSVGDIMDGELYVHGKPLQEIMSIVSPSKNIKEEAQLDLKFYWYDFIPKGLSENSYRSRFKEIGLEFGEDSPVKKLEPASFSYQTLEECYDNYMAEGYEGLMIRDATAPYYFGRRSISLLKYKKMQSDEFEIIDILESDNDEAPRFVCDLRNGNQVTVRLKGDKEDNLKYLNNKEEYLNQWLTINYQIMTVTGSLQFPVGVAIRPGKLVDGIFIPEI